MSAMEEVETGGHPDPASAIGRHGEVGPLQIKPSTARKPGVKGVKSIDPKKLYDPAENRRFGEELLRGLYKQYDGDLNKAISAWNWGQGNTDKAIKKHGDDWIKRPPQRTQNYFKKIHRMMAPLPKIKPVRRIPGIFSGVEETKPYLLQPDTITPRVGRGIADLLYNTMR